MTGSMNAKKGRRGGRVSEGGSAFPAAVVLASLPPEWGVHHVYSSTGLLQPSSTAASAQQLHHSRQRNQATRTKPQVPGDKKRATEPKGGTAPSNRNQGIWIRQPHHVPPSIDSNEGTAGHLSRADHVRGASAVRVEYRFHSTNLRPYHVANSAYPSPPAYVTRADSQGDDTDS